MPGERFNFAVSSLSCAPTDCQHNPLDIVWPPWATRETVRRIASMRDALKEVFPHEMFSTSLHVGFMLNTQQSLQQLAAANIPVSSVDTPDIKSVLRFLWDCGFNAAKRNWSGVMEHIGWQIASVTNINQFMTKVGEGIDGLRTQQQQLDGAQKRLSFVRANALSWRSRAGDELLKMVNEKRKYDRSLALAIEIDSDHQTASGFFEFVTQLRKNNLLLPIYYDMDLGQFARSKFIKKDHQSAEPLALFEEVLRYPKRSKLVAFTSLNQYAPDSSDIHINPLANSIDYEKAVRMLGIADRAGMLAVVPTILLESSPFDYGLMMSTEGLLYITRLKSAFYGEGD